MSQTSGYVHCSISTELDRARPTLENLVRHCQKIGMENFDGRGRPIPYRSYRLLAKDAATEVARAYLPENTYASFIRAIGYPGFEKAAREDWKTFHEEDDDR